MASLTKVYIILLNYNGWEDTIECLQSLLKLSHPHYHIIVVDNNSPNNSTKHLSNWAAAHAGAFTLLTENELPNATLAPESQLTFIQASRNGGFAAGNNLGIRLAMQQKDCAYLWLLNNDTTVAHDSLSMLVQAAVAAEKAGKNIGIWGSKLLFYHQPEIIQAVGGRFSLSTFTSSHVGENQEDKGQFDHPDLEIDYVVGASMFVSNTFVREVGLLEEKLFLYFEELDWATRALRQGYGLGYVWSSKVYHKEGKTIGSHTEGSRKSELADLHGIRSKIIYIRKFYPNRLLQLYLLLAGSLALRVKRLQIKRAWQVLKLIIQTR